jgi:hypothetical protein
MWVFIFLLWLSQPKREEMGNMNGGGQEEPLLGRGGRGRSSSSSGSLLGTILAGGGIALLLTGILVTGILATVFAKQAADNTAPNNARKIAFQTDFRDEVSPLGICEIDINDPLMLGVSLSPAQAWQSFGPLHSLFCSQTSVSGGRFRISNDDPAPAPGFVDLVGGNLWHAGPAVGAHSDESMGFEAVASFDFNVNNTAALEAYTTGTLVENNPTKDMRLVSPGIVFAGVDTHSPGCVPAVDGTPCFMAVCFFAAQNAMWAFYDTNTGFGGIRAFQRGVKIGDFPTSETHTYRGDIDRKNKVGRFYVDNVLKLTVPIGGNAQAPVPGALWLDRGTVPIPQIDPDYGIFFAGVSLNFRGSGVWPSGAGLEPPPYPPNTQSFPASNDKPSPQPFLRQAGVTFTSVVTYTQKSA